MNTYYDTKISSAYKRSRLQRMIIVRTKIFISVLVTLLFLALLFWVMSMKTEATNHIPENTYKYFTYHEIEKGDNLHDLAKEYISYEFYDSLQDYIDEVKEINHLKDDVLITGQLVVLHYFSTEYN